MLEEFSYVTETGKSWAGQIEKVDFKVYVAGFEEYLNRRGPLEITKSWRKGLSKEEQEIYESEFTGLHPLQREIVPDNWSEKDGYIQWSYKNFTPGDVIRFRYYFLTGLPQTIDQVKTFIKKFSKDELHRQDLQDLKEIILAYMGVPPKTKRVEEFVKNQIWSGTKKLITESELTDTDRIFLSEIDELISNTKLHSKRY